MPRRKGDLTRNRQTPEGRKRLWDAIRFLKRFSLEDLQECAGVGDANAVKYVIGLTRCGFLRLLQKADGQPGKPNLYLLVRNSGALPPMPQRDGSIYDANSGETFEPVEQQVATGRQRAWELMRRGEWFTTHDLARVMSQSGARVYVAALARAGILQVAQEGGNSAYKRYCLRRDVGDRAPVVKRDGTINGVVDEGFNDDDAVGRAGLAGGATERVPADFSESDGEAPGAEFGND